MPTVQEAYWNALLADATYAFEQDHENVSGQALIDLLKSQMTETLASDIAANFSLIVHIESDEFAGSGFGAVVWRGQPNGLFPGMVYLSMLGTEPGVGADMFVADVAAANTRRRAERGDGRWCATPSSMPRATQSRRSRSARC